MRLQADLNTTEPTSGATQPDVLVYKACKMLNPVQKRLNFQLHRWSLGSLCLIDLDIDSVTQDQLLFHRPPDFLPSSSRATFLYGPGDRALQECNLSTGPSVDCECIRPARCRKLVPDYPPTMLSQAMVQSEKLIVSTGRQAAFITRLPTNQSVDPYFRGNGYGVLFYGIWR
jgi:hypothetical protein